MLRVRNIMNHVCVHYVTDSKYGTAQLRNPEIMQLSERFTALPSASIREDEAALTLQLIDGRAPHYHVEHAVGSEKRPMSDGNIEQKFFGLAEPFLPSDQVYQLVRACWAIDHRQLDDAESLIKLAALRTK